MSIHVLSPGLSSSLQDLGRMGLRHLGVSQAGVMDVYSSGVANALVGNPASAAVVEMTLNGPKLLFKKAARIAICGASIDASLAGAAIPCWRRIDVPATSVLTLGHCRRGARAYLSVAGGFQIAPVLGSASTDLRSGFGGLHGRILVTGDELPIADVCTLNSPQAVIDKRWVDPAEDLAMNAVGIIRILPGHDLLIDPIALCGQEWKVEAASNRQGLRLSGRKLAAATQAERLSAPVMPGTIQLPPDGQPIVLMADAQTHGGYPVIGHAILADHGRLAQLRPGQRFRFAVTTPIQAQQALHEQHQRLARIRIAMESTS